MKYFPIDPDYPISVTCDVPEKFHQSKECYPQKGKCSQTVCPHRETGTSQISHSWLTLLIHAKSLMLRHETSLSRRPE